MAKRGGICAIIALRNEKGSYNVVSPDNQVFIIIALRNEKGSYNMKLQEQDLALHYSTAK